jgi:hypothetical protein
MPFSRPLDNLPISDLLVSACRGQRWYSRIGRNPQRGAIIIAGFKGGVVAVGCDTSNFTVLNKNKAQRTQTKVLISTYSPSAPPSQPSPTYAHSHSYHCFHICISFYCCVSWPSVPPSMAHTGSPSTSPSVPTPCSRSEGVSRSERCCNSRFTLSINARRSGANIMIPSTDMRMLLKEM